MTRTTTATLCLTMMLSFAACQQKQTASTATPTPAAPVATAQTLTPEQLGELGGLIKNNPDRVDDLLKQHNMTRESFEKAVREVTENVDASRRYSASYRKTVA